MLQSYQIREEQRARMPAVTHVNVSGHLQTVTRAQNPTIPSPDRAFGDQAGVPIVLNTSFNENEPVVCRPEEMATTMSEYPFRPQACLGLRMLRLQKLQYLTRMAVHRLMQRNRACPNCGGAESTVVSRKYLVTELRRCGNCLLLFRDPTDSSACNEEFYNDSYEQGFTTEMPDEHELKYLIDRKFVGTPKDYSYYISVLRSLSLARGDRLFDYGCSWGYGTWQLQQAGFKTYAFEISRSRRVYARERLGVRIIDNIDDLRSDGRLASRFDCFFSAHVLEHVPSPRKVMELADWLLKDGGLLVAFMPNGSEECRAENRAWNMLWGEVHPNFIDDVFLAMAFNNVPNVVASSPVDLAALARVPLQEPGTVRLSLRGAELVFAARKVNGSLAEHALLRRQRHDQKADRACSI
jgi:2-polyprenyl-3-methyl-5-hydroxy-6-metoxy-1,4-benzoquinol methylase